MNPSSPLPCFQGKLTHTLKTLALAAALLVAPAALPDDAGAASNPRTPRDSRGRDSKKTETPAAAPKSSAPATTFAGTAAGAAASAGNKSGKPDPAAGITDPFAPFVINTPDGLPIEVSLVSAVDGGFVLRNTASEREIPISRSALEKEAQTAVDLRVLALRRTVGAPRSPLRMNVSAMLYENNSTKSSMPRPTGSPIPIIKGRFDPLADAPTLEAVTSVDIPASGKTLGVRIQTGEKVPVEMPLDVYVYWYKMEKNEGKNLVPGVSATEQYSVLATRKTGELLVKPQQFQGTSYAGYAVFVVNQANRQVIGGSVFGRDSAFIRRDAVSRLNAKLQETDSY
ncbi:MAG: hypothetical protein LBR07_06865 [Puniceicoccales bacterium]|jgi:hypothetical protein|nr:hypothetical protein [Puniceicoccales bacterium]